MESDTHVDPQRKKKYVIRASTLKLKGVCFDKIEVKS